MTPAYDLSRRLAAEALGTAFLVATVVGSGIMAESLTRDVALALLGNTIATGAMLVVLITILGPISGAHFNPAVSMVFALRRDLPAGEAGLYICAQIVGGIAGTIAAHLMFALPVIAPSLKVRTGGAQWFSEFVATFGLVATILAGVRFQRNRRALAGRSLHHGGLLVYGVDVVCQSRRRHRAIAHQHLFRNSSGGSAGLHRRGNCLALPVPGADELAAAWTGDGCACARRQRPSYDRHDLSQPGLRHVPQHAGDDPAKRRRADRDRISETSARPRTAGRAGRRHGHLGARCCCVRKERPIAELGLGDPKWSDDELIDFMLAHPILINRPIVVTPKGVKLCRPSEAVLDILPNPRDRPLRQGGRRGDRCAPDLTRSSEHRRSASPFRTRSSAKRRRSGIGRASCCCMARCASGRSAGSLTQEAARLLERFGAETRIFDPSGLPLPDDAPAEHPKVQELRALSAWSEGQVWCSPERHGAMTGIMKAQIDWIPLSIGAVRPTQGRTLAVMQVSGGSQSFNAVNQLRVLGTLDADDHDPEPVVGGQGV